ncbi:MAG: phosphatidylglycerophosphatase A [Spirochaetota bacterium]|nr:MAG: phosphatidylglycerophosphatase A [Spirochaetota bacterium]
MIILIKIISTGLFAGYIPIASGTFGSILGCAGWIFVSDPIYYYCLTGLLLTFGFITSGYAEKEIFKRKDDRRIVIDEICGTLIAFLTHSFTFTFNGFIILAAGLIIFRVLDIVKPPPIRSLQKLKGSFGIMLDDIVAGVITNGILYGIKILMRVLS